MNAESKIRAFLANFQTAKLDLSALRAALAADATYQSVVPIAPLRRGADAICAALARQYELYDQCDCVIREVATSGNTVFTERLDIVRRIADGRSTTTNVVAVFDLDDEGRIWFWREYWDRSDCARQLGIDSAAMRRILCVEPSALAG